MSGSTPMTNLKVMGIIGVFMLILAYGAYLYVLPHNAPEASQSFVSGQVIAGNGYVQTEVLPISQAEAQTIINKNTVTPTPTVAPTAKVPDINLPDESGHYTPSLAPDGNIHYGEIVYVEKPTPTPKVIKGDNSGYYDNWNYFKTNGLNLEYNLAQNIKVKGGKPYHLSLIVTSTRETEIDHMIVTLTASTLNNDPNYNIVLPGFPMNIYDSKNAVHSQDSVDLSRDLSIPNVGGHYKLYVTIQCDNGANAQIMQEITIV